MSYSFSLKVTVNPEKEEERKKRTEKEIEEFIHRFSDFLKPTFLYDPLRIREFMHERDKLLREYDLGFRDKMLIKIMYRNVMEVKRRKEYELIGDDEFYGLWYFS